MYSTTGLPKKSQNINSPNQYTSGGEPIRIHSEKDVTAEEVVAEGDAMFQKCKKRMEELIGVGNTPDEAMDKIMTELRREHKQFCTSYPIVMRYMVQFGDYSPKAFMKYLNYVKYHPWNSEEAFIDSQATYVTTLYKHNNPKYNKHTVSTLHSHIKQVLMKEHNDFKNLAEESKRLVEAREQRLRQEATEDMVEFLRKNKAEMMQRLGISEDELNE